MTVSNNCLYETSNFFLDLISNFFKGMSDLSSLIRDQTHTPCPALEVQSFNYRTIREVPAIFSFFFFFIYFYWLEANYFIILWWFLPYIDMNQSWIYMYSPSWSSLPPPTASHPSGSAQCTRALVSCIQPGLVICFTLDSILVSVLFSKNIPPSPSPTESKSLFCTSVSLFLFYIYTM